MDPSYPYDTALRSEAEVHAAYMAWKAAQSTQPNVNAHQVPTFRPNVAPSHDGQPAVDRSAVLLAEDSVQDGGNAIDTFSSYVPTALPQCIVDVLREKRFQADAQNNSVASSDTTHNNVAAPNPQQEVIELLDSDDELEIIEINQNEVETDTQQTNTSGTTTSNSVAECTKSIFTTLHSHTSPAVESALLSSVSAPPVPNAAADVILPLVKEEKLSALQAEGVCLSVNRFRRVFRGDTGIVRAGFFIGDGAGIGKGRQIAATLLDALARNHGKGRHLWMSVSRELVQDAKRDLSDIGCYVNVHDGAEVLDQMSGGKKAKGLGAGSSLGKGVMFITYSLLVSGKRVEDIIAWLANTGSIMGKTFERDRERTQMEQSYSGCIVFDEAHKAKNLEQDTRTAKLVLALQERLPNARVLYCSATGVSDIKHMVYASRLGLWGSANPLYPTFELFNMALSKRGVGAQEMLALEMKRKGIFLARTLSWDGAEFHTLEVQLSHDQIAIYDGAVHWWLNLKKELEAATLIVGTPKVLWRAYWSAHQRFFKEICICSKIDEVISQAKTYLKNEDHAIVIGLQSTGEAGMEVALEELAESAAAKAERNIDRIDFDDMELVGLVSTCASIMTNFVRNHFPVAHPPPEAPKIPPFPPNGFANEADRQEHARLTNLADRIKNEPPPPPIPELVAIQNILLESILDLTLPSNPLDEIIDRLGGVDNVAEMTGRTGRVLRQKNGKYRYVKRFGGASKQKAYALSMPVSREDEQDRLNIVEKRKFMEGKKSVAIISDAASTGISLHADRRCQSHHKRRVHFTIELPWAADKAIQQLGRSHRSGQTTAPIYKMVVTELGGERRFASAVSKRMACMGALTKGDRRAASGSDLSEFDIDSNFGKRALMRTCNALNGESPTAPARNSTEILDKFNATNRTVSISEQRMKSIDEKRLFSLNEASNALSEIGMDTGDRTVKKFLNRIAGLDVARQNLVFSLFMATLDDVISDAKATGEFEGSVEDIRASSVTLKSKPEVIAIDTSCAATTELTRLILDRGVSFNRMILTIVDQNPSRKARDEDTEDDWHPCKSGFYLSRRKIAGRFLIMYAQRKNLKDDNSDFIDPLNLMVITRPNTGKNPCEMASDELRYKYKLLASVGEIRKLILSANADNLSLDGGNDIDIDHDVPSVNLEDAISVVREKWGKAIADPWDDAYDNSNHKDHHDGLAPRISEIGLITGAVLHILPSLETAVQFMPKSQRSLRVMRAELSNSGERIVGIKFPVTEQAVERLMIGMKAVSEARQGSLNAPSFVDNAFTPVDEKAKGYATVERKTMKSFFRTKSPPVNTSNIDSLFDNCGTSHIGSGKRKECGLSSNICPLNAKKQNSKSFRATQKSHNTSLTSFFKKKTS